MDCVREQARKAPRTTSVLGAPVRAGRPVVTLTILGLTVASWLLQLVTGGEWTRLLAFAPFIGEYEPYRFLTTAFLHSTSIFHILFNMYALWITGPYLERALGRWRFVALYVLAAVGGSVGYLVLSGGPASQSWFTIAVGASGAVFGLFGAIFLVMRRLGGNAAQILVLIGINFALGFFIPNIAWQAHLGGLIVGLVVGAGFAFAPQARRTVVSVAVTAGVAAVLVGTAMFAYAAYT